MCIVISTRVANRPTLRIGRCATRVLAREVLLCYCTVHTFRKSADASCRSICDMCVDELSTHVSNRPTARVGQFAPRMLLPAPASSFGRRFVSVYLIGWCGVSMSLVCTGMYALTRSPTKALTYLRALGNARLRYAPYCKQWKWEKLLFPFPSIALWDNKIVFTTSDDIDKSLSTSEHRRRHCKKRTQGDALELVCTSNPRSWKAVTYRTYWQESKLSNHDRTV